MGHDFDSEVEDNEFVKAKFYTPVERVLIMRQVIKNCMLMI